MDHGASQLCIWTYPRTEQLKLGRSRGRKTVKLVATKQQQWQGMDVEVRQQW
jgi:hypothetical protein